MAEDGKPRHSTGHLDAVPGGRLSSPSAERNQRPIADALTPLLEGRSGLMLEIGSGTGQHIAGWAQAFPALDWQPSEAHDPNLESIRSWAASVSLGNLRAPIRLDAAAPWPSLGALAGVISVNVIHISPWSVTQGIVAGAAASVSPGGVLIFYGPFAEDGRHTGDGNARFDASLRAQDASWGVRNLEDVARLAASAGFGPPQVRQMPANNRLVWLART